MTDTTPAPRPQPGLDSPTTAASGADDAGALRPVRVTVLDDPGAAADPSALTAGFARAALEPLALSLPEREQAAVVVLCRGLASPCAAFVLRRPERGEDRPGADAIGQDPSELARHLALETSRPVVLAAQAARIRNAAAALAALSDLEAAARDDLAGDTARAQVRRVGLEGRAAGLAPVLRAAGLAAEQVVVQEPAGSPTEEPPAPRDLARAGDVSSVLGRPASPRPSEPATPDVLLVPDLEVGEGASTPAPGPASAGDTRAFATAAPPKTTQAKDERPAGPTRLAWVDDDVDLVLPSLVRAAVDHATGPALLDDEGLGAVARVLAGLAQQGRLPAPDDPRLLVTLAPCAAAALLATAARERPREVARPETGAQPGASAAPAARVLDAEALLAYADALADLRSPLRRALRPALDAARQSPRRLVFVNGDDARVVRAARVLADDGLAVPWLLGDLFRLETRAKEQGISLKGIRVLDPARDKRRAAYAQALAGLLGPGALPADDASRRVEDPIVFAALAVAQGEADALLATESRADGLEGLDLAADLLGRRDEHRHLAGAHLAAVGGRLLVVTDTAGSSDPTSEEVADAALQGAWLVRRLLAREPRVAFLSFTAAAPTAARSDASVRRLALARDVARAQAPDLEVLGPVTLEAALDASPADDDRALVLVVPDRAAGAVLVGALRRLADAEALGPLAPALGRPATLAPRGPATTVDDLVLLGALTCALAGAPHGPRAEADDDRGAETPSRAFRLPTPATTRRLAAGPTPAPPPIREGKPEAPRTEATKSPAPRSEPPKTEAPKTEAPKTEAPKVEPPKVEPPKADAPKAPSQPASPRPDPEPRRAPPPPVGGGLAEKPSDVGLGSRGGRAAPPPKQGRPASAPGRRPPGGE